MKKKPDLLTELAALPPRPSVPRWEDTVAPETRDEVEQVKAHYKAGTLPCSLPAAYEHLKKKHGLKITKSAFRDFVNR